MGLTQSERNAEKRDMKGLVLSYRLSQHIYFHKDHE